MIFAGKPVKTIVICEFWLQNSFECFFNVFYAEYWS